MAGDIKVPIPSLPEADKVLKTDQIIFQGSTKTQRCTLTKLLTDLRVVNPDMNPDDVLGMIIPNNAGAHNSIYRGKNLGTKVTEAQWAEIKAGTFRDLFIGDYWTISGVNWRIAAFDYYYNTGNTPCRTHHVTLVPDTALYSFAMNATATTEGGYVGSQMYKEGLTQAKNSINTAFGESHILKHQQSLCNAAVAGNPSGTAWVDSTVELMNEENLFGGRIFGIGNSGNSTPALYTLDKSQFPLFAFRPEMISARTLFWLRTIVGVSSFARITASGDANYGGANGAHGVRPAFSIVG